MAKCKALEVPTYVLELTAAEAQTLMIVTHNVGGSESGRRGHLSYIQRVLNDAGLNSQFCHPDVASGDLFFRDQITQLL